LKVRPNRHRNDVDLREHGMFSGCGIPKFAGTLTSALEMRLAEIADIGAVYALGTLVIRILRSLAL